ncbi:MAG: hypothetical protein KC503_42050 [Myxococcales bacterium]|nr:hypothetical protein [Myxococcales bacterium]
MADPPKPKRAARIPPPGRKKRPSGSAAPLPAALRPADPGDVPPPSPDVPPLNVLSDVDSRSTLERPRAELDEYASEALHTVMLSATDLETYLGNGTLALSSGDLETLHTRGALSIADVLAAVRRGQSAEFSPVQPAGGFASVPSSARRDHSLWQRVRAKVRGLFAPRVRPLAPGGADDTNAAIPRATAAAAGSTDAGRAATEDDHAELRRLACDLQAYLDGVETGGATPRVLVRDGRLVGVILE